jgi:hypothetical protein
LSGIVDEDGDGWSQWAALSAKNQVHVPNEQFSQLFPQAYRERALKILLCLRTIIRIFNDTAGKLDHEWYVAHSRFRQG